MDMLQTLSSTFVLVLVLGVVAVVWVIGWQLLKIRRDARATTRRAHVAREADERIRSRLREQGFTEQEIADAVRHGTTDPG